LFKIEIKKQFKISHLLLLTSFAALVLYWTLPQETFPLKSLDEAARVNQSITPELRQVLGDTEGPFKLVSAMALNRNQAPNRTIRYQMDGSTKTYVIPKSFDGLEIDAHFFENPKRNNLVLLHAGDKP